MCGAVGLTVVLEVMLPDAGLWQPKIAVSRCLRADGDDLNAQLPIVQIAQDPAEMQPVAPLALLYVRSTSPLVQRQSQGLPGGIPIRRRSVNPRRP